MTVHVRLRHRMPRISESTKQKRTEQNLIYTAVNLKRKYGFTRRVVLLKLTTDRHEASRGSDSRAACFYGSRVTVTTAAFKHTIRCMCLSEIVYLLGPVFQAPIKLTLIADYEIGD